MIGNIHSFSKVECTSGLENRPGSKIVLVPIENEYARLKIPMRGESKGDGKVKKESCS